MGKILCEVTENKTDDDLERAINYFDKSGKLWAAMKERVPEIRVLVADV